MLNIERTLVERLPWLAARPVLRRPLTEALAGLAGEQDFNAVLRSLGAAEGLDFVEHALDRLGLRCRLDPREREHIPVDGPLLAVANHPLGMADALALLHLLGSVRRDVRVLGNDWLAAMPQLRSLLLPVDVFGGGARSRLREACRALDRGEALILFPAGEVSRLGPAGVRDGAWSDGFARLALRHRAPVLPVHVAARNSAAFYGMSMLARPLGTAMLPREAIAPGRSIGLSIGALVDSEELARRGGGSTRRIASAMRRHVYRLAHRRGLVFGGQAPLALPEPAEQVAAALRQGEKLCDYADGKQAWLFDGLADGPLRRELGRLRELAFRKVGEGTGGRRDLDAHDAHYQHLVLWDTQAWRIVGGYRLGHGGRLLAAHGLGGLYSASLFDCSPALEGRFAQGLELGRSFIAPAYWRSRALDQLWRGIGLYLQRHRELRYLFGPVSLSARLPREAREWIVAAHRHYFGMRGLATARRPFDVAAGMEAGVQAALCGLGPAEGLACLERRLEALGASLPVLYRQYVGLVEPDGVQFLDFGEDPDFSGCVDGLVMLDLARLKPAKRARYLGLAAA